MNYSAQLRDNLQRSIAANQQLLLDTVQLSAFGQAVQAVVETYRGGGRLYVAGNGGSAADAQHLAAEFVSKLARDRQPLPAEALTVDSSILTAIGNDYGYEHIFARQTVKVENVWSWRTAASSCPDPKPASFRRCILSSHTRYVVVSKLRCSQSFECGHLSGLGFRWAKLIVYALT